MEKLRLNGKKQFRNRLLVLLLVLLGGYSYSITPQQVRAITIVPQENVFFTNQELLYVLKIPGVVPAEVITQLGSLPEGINFVSSRRMEYFEEDDTSGTRIEFWFVFRDTGKKVIPPLSVSIKGARYNIPFDPVELYENPKTIAPRMVLEIKNKKTITSNAVTKKGANDFTVTANEPVEFMLYVQYATGIKNFGYEIPKDSFFEETKRFFSKDNNEFDTSFSQEMVPVASFTWTVLKGGKFSLPNIRMIAGAYSGRNVEISFPECTVTSVVTPASNSRQKKDELIFAYALTPSNEEKIEEDKIEVMPAHIEQIAALRIKERHTLFGLSKIKKQRVQAEREIGITASQGEANIPHTIICVVAFFALVAVIILLFVFHKKSLAFIFIAVELPVACFALIGSLSASKTYGIVQSGSISPVPEDSALTSTAVTLGTRVQILEKTENWYYIQYDQNGGWIKKNCILVVK